MPTRALRDAYAREAMGEALPDELAASLRALRDAGELPPPGADVWAPPTAPRPIRNNNPLNIKLGGATKNFAGIVGAEDAAEDGGRFLQFGTPEHGFVGALQLFQGPTYANLPIDAALKKWSNKGYGSEIAQPLGLDPRATISALSPDDRLTLMMAMAKREGYPIDRLDVGRVSSLLAPQTPVESTTTTPAGQPPLPFGQALMASLASEGRRQQQAVQQVGQTGAELFQPGPEASVTEGLGKTGRFLLSTLGAASPVLSPAMVAGGVGAETAARTGALPLDPETAAMVGSLATGGALMGPGLVRGGARLLSPSMRAGERAAAARAVAQGEQAGALATQQSQLAARAPAGTEAQALAETVANRLGGEADLAARTVPQGPLRLQPRAGRPEVLEPSRLVDEFGRPMPEVIRPARPPRTLTESDYTTGFKELRKTSERAGQAAVDFDRAVTAKLSRIGPTAASKRLASDPDLVSALLAHATPAEAAVIQRAVAAGQPLSKLPYTAEELAAVGQEITAGRSILSPLLHWGLGGAGLGYFTAGPTEAMATAATVLAARLALKSLDTVLASAPSAAILRQLGRVQPGSPDVVRILAGLSGEVAGGRRLKAPEH